MSARCVSLVLGIFVAVSAASAGCAGAQTTPSSPASDPAPDPGLATVLRATDIDGQPVRAGQVTALIVFASWCGPCRHELALLGELIQEIPRLQVIGISYAPYEEYDDLSNDQALRSFLADHAPWLQVVRATDALMNALGRPRKVPSLFLFDRQGRLVEAYLRARRRPPTKAELRARIMATLSNT